MLNRLLILLSPLILILPDITSGMVKPEPGLHSGDVQFFAGMAAIYTGGFNEESSDTYEFNQTNKICNTRIDDPPALLNENCLRILVDFYPSGMSSGILPQHAWWGYTPLATVVAPPPGVSEGLGFSQFDIEYTDPEVIPFDPPLIAPSRERHIEQMWIERENYFDFSIGPGCMNPIHALVNNKDKIMDQYCRGNNRMVTITDDERGRYCHYWCAEQAFWHATECQGKCGGPITRSSLDPGNAWLESASRYNLEAMAKKAERGKIDVSYPAYEQTLNQLMPYWLKNEYMPRMNMNRCVCYDGYTSLLGKYPCTCNYYFIPEGDERLDNCGQCFIAADGSGKDPYTKVDLKQMKCEGCTLKVNLDQVFNGPGIETLVDYPSSWCGGKPCFEKINIEEYTSKCPDEAPHNGSETNCYHQQKIVTKMMNETEHTKQMSQMRPWQGWQWRSRLSAQCVDALSKGLLDEAEMICPWFDTDF